MNMIIPNEGKIKWLMRMVDPTTHEDTIVELFKNDYTPVVGSVETDFTPATFTGYAPITIAAADWSMPTVVANVGQVDTDTVPEFVCTGGAAETVYGWFLRGATSDIVHAAQRFDSPRVMSNGSTERLDPFRIKLDTM
jgi:hypothetical protein